MIRVGVAGPITPDSFADNIASCLPDLGVTPVPLGAPKPAFRTRSARALLDIALRSSDRLDHQLHARLAERAAENECDIVLTTQALHPRAVNQLRAAGIRVALWYPDHVANVDRNLMFATEYDRLYLKDRLLVQRIAAVQGLDTAYLPEAANPHWHRVATEDANLRQLTVAGNIYPTRATLLERLLRDSVPVRLYGPRVPSWLPQQAVLAQAHTGSSIYRLEKAKVFRQSVGVLNNLHPSEVDSMNCRLFEAAGCGAAVLTEHRPALEELFDVTSEILSFKSYDELMSGWRLLLHEPETGRAIGDAAARRVLAQHTYQHRLRVILEDLA